MVWAKAWHNCLAQYITAITICRFPAQSRNTQCEMLTRMLHILMPRLVMLKPAPTIWFCKADNRAGGQMWPLIWPEGFCSGSATDTGCVTLGKSLHASELSSLSELRDLQHMETAHLSPAWHRKVLGRNGDGAPVTGRSCTLMRSCFSFSPQVMAFLMAFVSLRTAWASSSSRSCPEHLTSSYRFCETVKGKGQTKNRVMDGAPPGKNTDHSALVLKEVSSLSLLPQVLAIG